MKYLQHILKEEGQQSVTSADTSLNQTAAAFKKIPWEIGSKNVDIGGGKYEKATEYLAALRVTNYVYDPYNRTKEHNDMVLEQKPFDTATINNVLNVIPEEEAQIETLKLANRLVKLGGTIYVSVYEGNETGVGKQTIKGFQHNKKLKEYRDVISKVFDDYKIKNGMFVITN